MRLPVFLSFLALNGAIFTANVQAQATAPQSPPVLEWLKQAGIPPDAAGIVVAPAEGGKALLSHNAQQAFNPASVMKLYTTYGALELLGAPYTWKTQVLSSSKVQAGKLTGDVVIKGSGDPSLKIQDVWRLLRELRLSGVKHIAGDWVLDRSVFAEGKIDTCDFDGECARPYNVAPDGLLMNFNATRIAFKPAEGNWQVFADPLPLGWTAQGAVSASNGGCADWRSKLILSFKPHNNADGGVIQVGGSIPKICGAQEIYRAISPAQGYASGLVKTLWTELGGTQAGSFKAGATAQEAAVLAEIESDPLSTIVRDINKRSNNVMARMLYLNLARAPATTAQANKAASETRLRAWLGSAGLNDASLQFDNGSGLSREERASAAAITKLLQYAYAGPLMPEFMSSLAVMAQDGTVARRMGPRAGTAHVKTGTLKDSAALAGYVLGASGKRYAFTAIVNHSNVGSARAVFDKLVLWLQQEG
jgi:serine-type D-Ala-D-Ala carboxypeptidase/endopeptidase (penicillin-binding protein 4)